MDRIVALSSRYQGRLCADGGGALDLGIPEVLENNLAVGLLCLRTECAEDAISIHAQTASALSETQLEASVGQAFDGTTESQYQFSRRVGDDKRNPSVR